MPLGPRILCAARLRVSASVGDVVDAPERLHRVDVDARARARGPSR